MKQVWFDRHDVEWYGTYFGAVHFCFGTAACGAACLSPMPLMYLAIALWPLTALAVWWDPTIEGSFWWIVSLPANSCLFGVVAAVIYLQWFAPRRLRPGFCPGCEYDMRATLVAGRTDCPECGRAYVPGVRPSRHAEPRD